MKKILVLAVCIAGCLSAFGQGAVNFTNGGVGVNSPIFNVDGTTRLSGAGFMAQLVVDGTASTTAVAPFSAAAPGYFLGGQKRLEGIAPNTTVTATVRAWDVSTGATWEAAGIKGESSPFQLAVTGNADSAPAVLGTALVGLQSFNLVPEPSTIALAVLGGVALLFRRRK
jgi:hypothetical protein